MDNKAISPVLGVILMLAVTVVLATVVYLLSGNYADDAQTVPKISGKLSDHPDALTAGTADNLATLEHRGGDDCIDADDLEFRIKSQTSGTTYVVASDIGDFFCVGNVATLSEGGVDVPAGDYIAYVVYKPQQFIAFQGGVNIK